MTFDKYTVIKDTREQLGWDFQPTKSCTGTVIETLDTGDYSLKGFEQVLRIERKGTTGELASNIVQDRFDKELERLDKFPYPFLILEFDMQDILSFPANSGIPRSVWDKVRISKYFLLAKLMGYHLQYKTKIILSGKHGRDIASSIFKRTLEWLRSAK